MLFSYHVSAWRAFWIDCLPASVVLRRISRASKADLLQFVHSHRNNSKVLLTIFQQRPDAERAFYDILVERPDLPECQAWVLNLLLHPDQGLTERMLDMIYGRYRHIEDIGIALKIYIPDYVPADEFAAAPVSPVPSPDRPSDDALPSPVPNQDRPGIVLPTLSTINKKDLPPDRFANGVEVIATENPHEATPMSVAYALTRIPICEADELLEILAQLYPSDLVLQSILLQRPRMGRPAMEFILYRRADFVPVQNMLVRLLQAKNRFTRHELFNLTRLYAAYPHVTVALLTYARGENGLVDIVLQSYDHIHSLGHLVTLPRFPNALTLILLNRLVDRDLELMRNLFAKVSLPSALLAYLFEHGSNLLLLDAILTAPGFELEWARQKVNKPASALELEPLLKLPHFSLVVLRELLQSELHKHVIHGEAAKPVDDSTGAVGLREIRFLKTYHYPVRKLAFDALLARDAIARSYPVQLTATISVISNEVI